MTSERSYSRSTGLSGPVALYGGLVLLLISPMMRGGNRYPALMILELNALVILLAAGADFTAIRARQPSAPGVALLAVVAMSPLILALAQLLPLPGEIWSRLPGRQIYAETLASLGLPIDVWRPLSISPDATAASLLAGLPVVAALVLGYLASRGQLRLLLRGVVAVAMLEVAMGLLQISGGDKPLWMFGALTGAPVGTFGNRNHFASYLVMAIFALLWLRLDWQRTAGPRWDRAIDVRQLLWLAGGLLLILGLLMSRSRGAVITGLPLVLTGLAIVEFPGADSSQRWRIGLALTLVLLGAVVLIGIDAATSRYSAAEVTDAMSFRGRLALTSLQGALAFWPWGSGWGTYDLAYPRFQPADMPGFANHAHMDYIEMLFEGGIVFVGLALALLWLVVRQGISHWRDARGDDPHARNRAVAAVLCGLGVLAVMVHSLVEFNMRIPANAILCALLMGAFLRPSAMGTRPR